MKRYNISDIELGSVCNSIAFYDEDFFLFLPDTVITEPILQFLSEQHSIFHYQSDEQISVQQIDELMEDEYTESESNTFLHDTYTGEYQFFPEAFREYSTMSNDFSQIMENIHINETINFNEIKQFVYDKIIPQVYKDPIPYLSIGEFETEKDDKKVYGYLLRCMLFIAALLKADRTKTFPGVEKQADITLSALFCNIGIISILNKLPVNKRNISFYNDSLSKLIPQVSLTMIKKSSVPPLIYEAIAASKKHFDETTEQYHYKSQKSGIFQLMNITNLYVYLTAFTSPDGPKQPLQALKKIISVSSSWFDPKYVKIFVDILGLIPPGVYVELQNKCKCITLIPQHKTPKSPIVQIITTANGKGTNKLNIISTNHAEFALKKFIPPEEIPALRLHRKKILKRFLQ